MTMISLLAASRNLLRRSAAAIPPAATIDAPIGPRIVLISPKGPLYRHRGGIFRKSLRYMPLTLPTLASLVPAELKATVTCIDEGIDDVDLQIDADLVGLTVITGTANRAYELSAKFRSRGISVVMGGPHVTLVPDEAQEHADSIVVGYAEEEWPRLLRDFAAGAMQPRYSQSAAFRLGGFPLPQRSVLPVGRYLTGDVFESTRGCVHNCSFCVVPAAWGRRPLQKPIEEIVSDIKERQARRAIFIDLNLIADKDYAAQLFTALIPLKIQWYGLATTLLCDDKPLLDLAARSGCRGLLMGLESISASSLRRTHKSFNQPDEYPRVVEELHRRGIALQGCFVFGLDDDTPDVFLKTARFAVECGIDLPRFAVVTPFPSTEIYKQLAAEGRILTRNWELYDGQHVVFQPAQMSPAELLRGAEQAWRYVYSWRNIARRLRHTPASWHLALVTNLGYRHYAYRLHRFYNCDWPIEPAGRPRRGAVNSPTTESQLIAT
jgi:radical SAM superfamily enzyme YgiQ (UPF0313 family)